MISFQTVSFMIGKTKKKGREYGNNILSLVSR